MNLREINAALSGVVPEVKRWALEKFAPVAAVRAMEERLVALEGRAPIPGPVGERGADGAQGAAGPSGPAGEPGARGEKGDPGPAGERGADGTPGPAGPPGPPGPQGPPGERGSQGERGEAGPEGRRGISGEPGPAGERGERGEKGADGRDGRDGVQGPPGRDGKDGAPGRDGISREEFAAALEVETQRALAAVVASIEFDGRTLRIGERTFRVPSTRYRGVYREGDTYDEGDMATWAGSLWHANAATTEKPGDGSAAWTLAVKRGRDGRDGKDAPAPPPVVRVGASR